MALKSCKFPCLENVSSNDDWKSKNSPRVSQNCCTDSKGPWKSCFSPMNVPLKQLSCKYWNIFKNVWCHRNDCGVTKWFCWHGSREIIPNVFWGITYLRTVCYCNRRSNLKRKRCHYILIYSLYFRNKRSKSQKVVALRKIKHQKGFSLICFANTRWLSGATGLLVWGLCQRMTA